MENKEAEAILFVTNFGNKSDSYLGNNGCLLIGQADWPKLTKLNLCNFTEI